MNTKIISLTIAIIFIMILIPSSYKVYLEYQDNLITVTEKRIVEAAIKCKKENLCTSDTVSLKFLYENSYLEEEFNPITKEYYNENNYITLNPDEYQFVEVKP